MKKISLILFLLCLNAVFVFAQTSWKGFYRTQFFNVLGDAKVIEAEFEVRADNRLTGKLKISGQTRDFEGEVESKGKFEARTQPENGVVTLVKGELPSANKSGNVSLVERAEQRGNGSKTVSKSELTGIITRLPAGTVTELRDVDIVDNGKTQLWLQHPNSLFGKEWIDYPATVKVVKTGATIAFEMEMKLKTETDTRRLAFRILVRQENQKLWSARDIAFISYGESKKDADGKGGVNAFMDSGNSLLGGQLEIISENEQEIVFKITNLRIKQTAAEHVLQIDGYIYAIKK